MRFTESTPAVLILQDGTIFHGKALGKIGTHGGEICFNTGMTGYQEIYTDPSYAGQVIINTTAHIGNYGVMQEAEAESKRLSGEGIAKQRLEIVRGFKESVEDFKKSLDTVTHEEIMQFVLMTQYFDTIKDIGANSKNSSILMPHSPGGMKEFQEQIITGTFVGNRMRDDIQAGQKSSTKKKDAE